MMRGPRSRNLREEVAKATLGQLRLQAVATSGKQRSDDDDAIAQYEKLAADQAQKKDVQR